MLNAKKMRDPATWQTDLDTLMQRVSEHYIVDEDAYVSELIKLLNADQDDFSRAVQPGYPRRADADVSCRGDAAYSG